MTKLALCFSGHPRNFILCFPTIYDQIITKFDCDIFITMYHVSDNITNKIINMYKPKSINIINEFDPNYISLINEYSIKLGLSKIKHLTIYPSDHSLSYQSGNYFYEDNKYEITYEHIKSQILCQFYGIHIVASLCHKYINENNVNYDYILRLRFDAKITGNFTITPLQENQVVLANILNYSNSLKVNDHFFMAKPNTFFKISNLYIKLPDIINYVNNTNGIWLPGCGHQETILFLHIYMQNINIIESLPIFEISKNFEAFDLSTIDNPYNIPFDFNPTIYKHIYNDLTNMTDEEAIQHYICHGINENRKYKYEDIFNPTIYKSIYPDLQHMNDNEATQHFYTFGINEKRKIHI